MWPSIDMMAFDPNDAWSFQVVVLFLIVTFICVKVLKFLSYPEVPIVKHCIRNGVSNRMQEVVAQCPLLRERYIPPFLWGRNGLLQTIAYGTYLRLQNISLQFERHSVGLKDGGTSTFDVFEPLEKHIDGIPGDVTIAICPGIANSSESSYIRNCVNFAQKAGYRCAVLNHLGALRTVKLTSSRIFTYGGTEEFAAMLQRLRRIHPQTRFIVAGFSMGANVVTKFLGEGASDLSGIVAGVSICQGYDASRGVSSLHRWDNLGRLSVYVMAENIKRLLRDHYDTAVAPHVASGLVDEAQLWSCTSLLTLDDIYSRRVAGFGHVEEYYKWSSCVYHMKKIPVPMVYMNAADDPIVPQALYEIAADAAENNPNVLFVLPKHGGHLGFLRGGLIQPTSVTWMEEFLVQICDATLNVYGTEAKLMSRKQSVVDSD